MSPDTKRDLLGVDVPIDPENLPLPTCPTCGQEIEAFYSFVHRNKLPDGAGTLLLNSFCCPYASCRAVIITCPAGVVPDKIASPGKPGWPGIQ